MIRSFGGVLPTVPTSCYVDPSAQVIGDVVMGDRASVWMNAVVRGDVNAIRIGARSNVQDCAVLHGMRHRYSVHVGEMVTIGHNATVHGCTVGDAVLIGIGAIVLNDARIGEGSIVAAGQWFRSTWYFHRGRWWLEFRAGCDGRLKMLRSRTFSSTHGTILSTRPRTWRILRRAEVTSVLDAVELR